LLRNDYDEPGGNDDTRLHRITWDEFFKIFEENDIAFLHDPDGDSRFSKFVAKESADCRVSVSWQNKRAPVSGRPSVSTRALA
jgi:hypothetical protein